MQLPGPSIGMIGTKPLDVSSIVLCRLEKVVVKPFFNRLSASIDLPLAVVRNRAEPVRAEAEWMFATHHRMRAILRQQQMPVATTMALGERKKHKKSWVARKSPKLFRHCEPNCIVVQSIHIRVRFEKLSENGRNHVSCCFRLRCS